MGTNTFCMSVRVCTSGPLPSPLTHSHQCSLLPPCSNWRNWSLSMMTFTLGSQSLSILSNKTFGSVALMLSFILLYIILSGVSQHRYYVLTLDVGPFLVDLELSSLSPEFFPGLVFTEFHCLAFDPLGLLGVALSLILDLDLGCLP